MKKPRQKKLSFDSSGEDEDDLKGDGFLSDASDFSVEGAVIVFDIVFTSRVP